MFTATGCKEKTAHPILRFSDYIFALIALIYKNEFLLWIYWSNKSEDIHKNVLEFVGRVTRGVHNIKIFFFWNFSLK